MGIQKYITSVVDGNLQRDSGVHHEYNKHLIIHFKKCRQAITKLNLRMHVAMEKIQLLPSTPFPVNP